MARTKRKALQMAYDRANDKQSSQLKPNLDKRNRTVKHTGPGLLEDYDKEGDDSRDEKTDHPLEGSNIDANPKHYYNPRERDIDRGLQNIRQTPTIKHATSGRGKRRKTSAKTSSLEDFKREDTEGHVHVELADLEDVISTKHHQGRPPLPRESDDSCDRVDRRETREGRPDLRNSDPEGTDSTRKPVKRQKRRHHRTGFHPPTTLNIKDTGYQQTQANHILSSNYRPPAVTGEEEEEDTGQGQSATEPGEDTDAHANDTSGDQERRQQYPDIASRGSNTHTDEGTSTSELSLEEAIGDELLFQSIADLFDDIDNDVDNEHDSDGEGQDHVQNGADTSQIAADSDQNGNPSSVAPRLAVDYPDNMRMAMGDGIRKGKQKLDTTDAVSEGFDSRQSTATPKSPEWAPPPADPDSPDDGWNWRTPTPEIEPNVVNYMDPRAACSKKDFATIAHHNIRVRTKITREGDEGIRLFQRAIGKRRAKLMAIQNRRALDKGLELGLDEEKLRAVLKIANGNGVAEDLYVAEVRTARKIVTKITGISVLFFDRCVNNCKAFEMNEVANRKRLTLFCDHCGESRYKDITREGDPLVAKATFPYIPVEPRIRLWFSEPSLVQLMTEYRRFVEKEAPNQYIDFFSGSQYQEKLKPTGRFSDPHQRDLALLMSMDEFGPFKKRPWFKVAPILITCFNIPPELRFKDRFLTAVGFIPGQTNQEYPARPRDRLSFLRPLVDEMKKIGSMKGIRCWDALGNEEFDLRAHLCVAVLDMAERFITMGTKGYSARMCCEYCKVVGLYHTKRGDHIYCPHRAPIDAPRTSYQLEDRLRRQGKGYFEYSAHADRLRVEGRVELRDPQHFERIFEHYRAFGPDPAVAYRWGVVRETILNEIDTIMLPWSFPPDLLHLLKGIAVRLMEHYTGEFTKSVRDASARVATKKKKNDARRAKLARARQPSPTPSVDDNRSDNGQQYEPEVESEDEHNSPNESDNGDTSEEEQEEEYVISDANMRLIGEYQDRSRATVPTSIGGISNMHKYAASMKADDWFSWILQQSPIYLSKFLPTEHFNGYMLFVHIAELLAFGTETKTYGRSLTHENLADLDRLIKEFSKYYEEKLYRLKWKRLAACRVLIHQLDHTVESIRRLGPMGNYTQFPIERFIGITDSLINNRSDTNAHLVKVFLHRQQINALPFVLPLTEDLAFTFFDKISGPADTFYDKNGNLRVTKLFALAVDLDNIAGQAIVDGYESDMSVRPSDREPWYPPENRFRGNLGGHPRPHLPLAVAGEDSGGSDVDEFEERGQEQIVDVNMVLGRPSKNFNFSTLTHDHQTKIIRALSEWNVLPGALRNISLADQKKMLAESVGMDIRRWRTLFVGKRRQDLTNPMAFSMFEVTGTEEPHHFRKRSAAAVHYNFESVTGKKYTRFGKVLYFVSLDNLVAGNDSPVQIAVLERYKITRDPTGHFLMSPKGKGTTVEVINCRWIEEPVGLLQWTDGIYVTWHNGSTYKY